MQSNGITPDGDGFTISGGDHGVLASGKIGITLTHLDISGKIWGVWIVGSGGATISKNTMTGVSFGVQATIPTPRRLPATGTLLAQSAKTEGRHNCRDK